MNREIPEGVLSEGEREHRRRLWWTVYILDRKLSINMGSPLSGLQDEDIDVALPNFRSHAVSSEGLSLHVKVTRLTGLVMMGGHLPTKYSLITILTITQLHTVLTAASIEPFSAASKMYSQQWQNWQKISVAILR